MRLWSRVMRLLGHYEPLSQPIRTDDLPTAITEVPERLRRIRDEFPDLFDEMQIELHEHDRER